MFKLNGGVSLHPVTVEWAIGYEAIDHIPCPPSISEGPDDPTITMPYPSQNKPSINFTKLPVPISDNFCPISSDRFSVENQYYGLIKRVLRDLPELDEDVYNKFFIYVLEWVNLNITPLVHVLTFEEWLATTNYNENRKKQLRVAYAIDNGRCPPAKYCQKIMSFGKLEFYTKYKHLRWINSRSDRFKAFSGRFFKSMEIDLYKDPHFVKHLTPAQRAVRTHELYAITSQLPYDRVVLPLPDVSPGVKCVSSDFTSFEGSFSSKIMEACELQLYKRYLLHYPDIYEDLAKTIAGTNVGSTKQKVRFKVKARRMSGDMCTSLGNGFTNYMLWSFFMNQHGNRWDGIVEGDDGLFMYEGSDITEDEFYSLGFEVKLTPHEDPMTASFCGVISSGVQSIRDPRNVLDGFGWTESKVDSVKVRNELLRSKAISLIYETPGCPILAALGSACLKLTEGFKARFKNFGDNAGYKSPPLIVPVEDVLPETRLLFQRMYGVSVSLQLIIESDLSRGCFSSLNTLMPNNSTDDYGLHGFLNCEVLEYSRRYLIKG
jgi:hypothetical protein